jgi:signal transduction histidine kinase
MAGQRLAASPLGLFHGALGRLAALPTRNIRATVFLCVVAIGGSFAAAGALQMRFDRAQAYHQAVYFEARRAHDIAAIAGASLGNYERVGRAYAAGMINGLPPGVRGIAVAGQDGVTRLASGAFLPMENLAEPARHGRVVLGTSQRTVIAFTSGTDIIALSFDALLPPALLNRAQLLDSANRPLAGAPPAGEFTTARVQNWPVEVRVALDDENAVAAWYGSLPLYLFVIIGPALVGAWLAAVFVGEFERRAKAAQAIRSLRATRPEEARLLVRLAAAERQAAESQRSKAEFIAHMSHELRTPLNAIIGFAEVIERGFYGAVGHAKYVEYARDIGMAGRHLHTQVGDILEYADLEAGRYPLKPVSFDATELVGTCVHESAGRAFSRRISLEMVPAAPAAVFADPLAVKRIVANLLANALTFTPEGGRVRVSVREEEGAVAIGVADTGRGFSPGEVEAAGTAFRRFERVGVSTGAGLGLAIVVALARRMGGAVKLSSTSGEGTSAEFRMPKG